MLSHNYWCLVQNLVLLIKLLKCNVTEVWNKLVDKWKVPDSFTKFPFLLNKIKDTCHKFAMVGLVSVKDSQFGIELHEGVLKLKQAISTFIVQIISRLGDILLKPSLLQWVLMKWYQMMTWSVEWYVISALCRERFYTLSLLRLICIIAHWWHSFW